MQKYKKHSTESIGELIKSTRENYTLSLSDLESLTGIDRSHLHKIEKAEINPGLDRFLKIANALQINISSELIPNKIMDKIDFINKEGQTKSIKDLALALKTDRAKLKKRIKILVEVGKLPEEILVLRKPTAIKYRKEIEEIKKAKTGDIIKYKKNNASRIAYIRSLIKGEKDSNKKDFLTKTVGDELIIVRIS